MIAAGWRSSGKTTVALGLAAALARRGLAVQPFKRGPDFIDPQWLAAAAGRTCRNLDLRLQGTNGVVENWQRYSRDADVALVEASQGLHDGLADDGSDSNAALARLLGIPVVVVLDARGMGRNAAALLMGLAHFDPRAEIAGVILNRLGGARHEARLRRAIETHVRLPVIGALREDARLSLVERHLGLMPACEASDVRPSIDAIADAIEAHVAIDAIPGATVRLGPRLRGGDKVGVAGGGDKVGVAGGGDKVGVAGGGDKVVAPAKAGAQSRVTLGIPRDRAFGFYYPDNLEALRAAGARLTFFDTLHDAHLPLVDGLFLGGGFPEALAERLEANVALRSEIRAALEGGMPAYAECGGLMYLARSVTYLGRTHRMVGALACEAIMHARPVGKGYVTLTETGDHPWARGSGATVAAHEFHHSSIESLEPGARFAYRVTRGHGFGAGRDGLVHRNILASYAHLRSVGGNDWAGRFVAFVERHARLARAAQSMEMQA